MIAYNTHRPITADQFVDLLNRSTLAERRPVDDPAAIAVEGPDVKEPHD